MVVADRFYPEWENGFAGGPILLCVMNVVFSVNFRLEITIRDTQQKKKESGNCLISHPIYLVLLSVRLWYANLIPNTKLGDVFVAALNLIVMMSCLLLLEFHGA